MRDEKQKTTVTSGSRFAVVDGGLWLLILFTEGQSDGDIPTIPDGFMREVVTTIRSSRVWYHFCETEKGKLVFTSIDKLKGREENSIQHLLRQQPALRRKGVSLADFSFVVDDPRSDDSSSDSSGESDDDIGECLFSESRNCFYHLTSAPSALPTKPNTAVVGAARTDNKVTRSSRPSAARVTADEGPSREAQAEWQRALANLVREVLLSESLPFFFFSCP